MRLILRMTCLIDGEPNNQGVNVMKICFLCTVSVKQR